MLSILVASSKGGCGKTTLSTHLAAYFALAGKRTVLVDADPQGSSTRWSEKRSGLEHVPLTIDGRRRGWQKAIPDDTERCVIDAPAGARAKELSDYLTVADAIVVPVQPSIIDIEATVDFLNSLAADETVRKRKLPVALVANRMKPWTSSSASAAAQFEAWPYPLVATLRDTQSYALLCGLGKSLFDYRSELVRSHQSDWDGLLKWLRRINRAK